MEDKGLVRAGNSLARVQIAMDASLALKQTLKAAQTTAEDKLSPEQEQAMYALERLRAMQERLFDLRFDVNGEPIEENSYASRVFNKIPPPKGAKSAIQRLRSKFGGRQSALRTIVSSRMGATVIQLIGPQGRNPLPFTTKLCIPEEGECWIRTINTTPVQEIHVEDYFNAYPEHADAILWCAQHALVDNDVKMANELVKVLDDFSDLPDLTRHLCALCRGNKPHTGIKDEELRHILAAKIEAG